MARRPRLTRDAILVRVHGYVVAQGRFPATTALHTVGLTVDQIRKAFGGMQGLQRAYRQVYSPTHTPQGGPQGGIVTCLKCGQRWLSPDRRYQHNHEGCNREVRPDGSWMTGEAARDDWWALFDEEDSL